MSESSGQLIDEASGEAIALAEVSAIGRNRDAEVLISDPRVSRRHAMIRRQADGYWFFDLGSINGTYINGRRVTTSQLLAPGDILRIADRSFRFEGQGNRAHISEETLTEATIIQTRSVEAVLLVSDVQSFTMLSEQLSPDELAPIIGSWYERTERLLARHGATLDKFLGDSVLAYWLGTAPDDRRAALQTAAAMQQACAEVDEQHRTVLARQGLEFRSGTALHLGAAAYGSFSQQEFTLLGDAVNVAFRLEALTRQLGVPILISGEFFRGWDEGRALCRALGPQSVKGRAQTVEVYAYDGPDGLQEK